MFLENLYIYDNKIDNKKLKQAGVKLSLAYCTFFFQLIFNYCILLHFGMVSSPYWYSILDLLNYKIIVIIIVHNYSSYCKLLIMMKSL